MDPLSAAERRMLGLIPKGPGIKKRPEIFKGPFKWLGSKTRSLDDLLPLLPVRKGWCDVFGGSGIVTLARQPCKLEVFNDLDGGIVAFYKALRDQPKLLLAYLEMMPLSREQWEESYKADGLPNGLVQRAAHWYYTIQNSYGGKGRAFGYSTSPHTSQAGVMQRKLPYLNLIHERIKNVQLENLDWQLMLERYDHPDTVMYLDPPYYGCSSGLYFATFPDSQHEELVAQIFKCKSFVALSGYANPIYDHPRWKWTARREWSVRGNMQQNDGRGTKGGDVICDATEVLWIKEAQ